MILKLVPFVRFDHLCCACSLSIFAWSFPTFEAIPWMEPAVLLGSFEIKADLLGSSNRNLIAFSGSAPVLPVTPSLFWSSINARLPSRLARSNVRSMCSDPRLSLNASWTMKLQVFAMISVVSLSKRKNLCQSYFHKNSDFSFLHAPKDSRCFLFGLAVAWRSFLTVKKLQHLDRGDVFANR